MAWIVTQREWELRKLFLEIEDPVEFPFCLKWSACFGVVEKMKRGN